MSLFRFFLLNVTVLSFTTHPLRGQNLESQIDDFYSDLIVGLKAAKIEKNDSKAVSIIREMKLNLGPRAEALAVELDHFLVSKSEDEILNWEDKIKEKPFNKEIFDLTFDISFIERLNRSKDFEISYHELIDLSDKVIEVAFAEPVDPESACTLTLNGGPFKNKVFNLPPTGMKDAVAFMDEGILTFNIEGYAGTTLIGVSFFVENSAAGVYKWKGDYNLSFTIFDGQAEMAYGGHEGNGMVVLEKVESIGGWVVGKFSGRLIGEEGIDYSLDIKGSFKVRRDIEQE